MPPTTTVPVRHHVKPRKAGLLGGPAELFHSLVHYRHIIGQFTRREVLGRYRGSYMGIFWTFLNPLLLLGIFTVVFKYVFHAKFGPDEGPFDFGLKMFSGLIIYNLFAECLGRAPMLILSNANYVTKVVFPLEILPVTVVLSGVLHLLISFVPLCLGVAFLRGVESSLASAPHGLPLTILYWPLLLPPIFCWGLGITLALSALGVFIRDLNQAMLAFTTILMYASAVFYPLDRVPLALQHYVRLNPVAFFCEQSRNLAVGGLPMDWPWYGWVSVSGLVFVMLAYTMFMRVKHTFADVI